MSCPVCDRPDCPSMMQKTPACPYRAKVKPRQSLDARVAELEQRVRKLEHRLSAWEPQGAKLDDLDEECER